MVGSITDVKSIFGKAQNKDLDLLREREDFKKLLSELAAKKK